MKRPQRLAGPLIIAAFAALSAGCTTVTTTSTTAGAGDGIAMAGALPAEGSVAGADLLPGREGKESWTSKEGLLAPGTFEVTTVADGAAGRHATRTADLETARWSVTDRGEVVMHSVDSHPDKTSSLFDPPLLLAPASLAAGEERTVESSMRAVFTATPDRERDHGHATRTVRYDRDESIRWRGEQHRAKVVTVRFRGELGTATADRTSELWVIPGTGIVAERWTETLTILKVFTKKSSQFAFRE